MLSQLQRLLGTERGLRLQLYTDEFYQTVVSKKLAPGGIFVTQSGPAGVISCTEVGMKTMFTPLNPTCERVLSLRPALARLQHVGAGAQCWLGVDHRSSGQLPMRQPRSQ